MKFIRLNRTFVPIKHADEVTADAIEAWGRHGWGAKTWPELLEAQRVVVLAEANSGKTGEFQDQVARLGEEGKDGFFAAIEAVAGNGFINALPRGDRLRFEAWKATSRPGWFLLDSLDEARIRQKTLETALGALERDLGEAYDRARLIISCRGTDWQGETDLKRLRRYFPIPQPPPVVIDAEAELVSVLDRDKPKPEKGDAAGEDISVFVLTPLSGAQRTAFLVGRDVTDIDAFEEALVQRGLRPMTERPGDLDTLVSYWKTHQQFGSLHAMTDNAVWTRLKEREDRPQRGLLSLTRAREGAERLAAAMTLGRKLTIGVLDDGAIPSDSLDPALVLDDWNGPDRAALLQLGIFAPASFGRIRFHHRSAIEFLAASWFKRLVTEQNLSVTMLMGIVVNDPFNVATIAPSLRAMAAWLAPDVPVLREYLIQNEPLVLISGGDPTRLPLKTRITLLRQYAIKSAEGAVPDHGSTDDHALWMFGDPAMSAELLTIWDQHDEWSFRYQLVRLIDMAKIPGCEALLRRCTLDPKAENALRIAAARALAKLQDVDGLKALAKAMLSKPSAFGPRLAPYLAAACFPVALSVKELLALIDKTEPPREFQVEGFGYAIGELYGACVSSAERRALLSGLAKLSTTPPVKDYDGVSERHFLIMKKFGSMLRQAIVDSDKDGVSDGLVDLLSCTSRIGVEDRNGDDLSIHDLLSTRNVLRQRLIWRDIHASFERYPDQKAAPTIWPAANWSRSAWSLGPEDHDWLMEAVKGRADLLERRVALSGLYAIWRGADDADARLDAVAAWVSGDEVLSGDLKAWRTPREETEWEKKSKASEAARERAEAIQRERGSEHLRAMRDRLNADPSPLSNAVALAEWPGPLDLLRLTDWLRGKSDLQNHKASTEHALLGPVFSPQVHAAYCAGLKTLWRITPPERPVTEPGKGRSTKHTSILSVAGLNLEAMEEGWMAKLNDKEIQRAAQHACWIDLEIPEWLAALYEHRPAVVGPVILDEVHREWAKGDDAYTPFLNRNFLGKVKIEPLRSGVWNLLVGDEPAWIRRIGTIQTVLRALELSPAEHAQLLALVQKRLAERRAKDDWPWIQAYLGLLFDLDPNDAIEQLHVILGEQKPDLLAARSQELLGDLFGGFRGGAVPALSRAEPTAVAKLVHTVYRHVCREDDADPEVIETINARDEAEMGRNAVLTTLIEMPGEEPYRLMRALATQPDLAISAHRFEELARRMAEVAAERPVWLEKQVADFERSKKGPIRTPDELADVIVGLLGDLSADMQIGDSSPRSILETAKDEYAVQDMLAWYLTREAAGRFTAVREKQINSDLRPDIGVTASISSQELAIEVKHGEMNWTLPALEDALRNQLARDYLKVPMRRRGILLISNHRKARFWWDKEMETKLSFADAVAYLSEIAKGLTENETGPIRVSVHGLDVSDPKANRSKSRKDGVARVKPQSGKPAKALAPKKVVPKRGGRAQ